MPAAGETAQLHVLCAGAAQGLVEKLVPICAAQGVVVHATFGAVGTLRDRWRAGAACDVAILTAAMLEDLAQGGQVDAATCAAIGRVPTSVAVVSGAPAPDIATGPALRESLRRASALYLPDPVRSTAGAHVAHVLARLDLAAEVAPRLRPFPNGATAMRELAAAGDRDALGCTQSSEILRTPGVVVIGPLPAPYGLETVYAAGVATGAAAPECARRFVQQLTGPGHADLRAAAGFAP
jgi:molybdate transport system substrate-binding protein